MKGEAVLGPELQVAEPVAGPAQLGRAQRRRGAGGSTRHGGTGDAGSGSRLEIRCARGQTTITRHLDERVLGTRLDTRTAPGARRQKADLSQCARRPEVPARDDSVLGLHDETLEPVANCRSEENST